MYKRGVVYGAAAFLGIVTALILTSVFTVITIRGSGMEPTVYDGDKVLINKIAYTKDMPSEGDIIAFRSNVYGEEGEGSMLVRRVVGVDGDTVEIKNNMVYLNERPYNNYMKEPVSLENMEKVSLDKGEVFVLSDNRRSSMDSRNEAIGILEIEDCIGKVVLKWNSILN